MDAECILAGFLSNGFPILVLARQGNVCICDDFAVAGEGSYLAQSVLLHREHTEVFPLERGVYSVFEAKKYAERVSSVGKMTYLGILRPDKPLLFSAGDDGLDNMFQQYGPKPLGKDLSKALHSFVDVSKLAAA